MTRPQPQFDLSPILTGALLGDGSLSKKGEFSYCCVDESTVKFLVQHLRDMGSPVSSGSRFMKSGYPNQKRCYWLTSGARFKEARATWYPSGIKRVPRPIDLSPYALRWWFIGDGSVQLCGPKKNSLVVHLHSESFPRSDQEHLQAMLSGVGLKASIVSPRENTITSASQVGVANISSRRSAHALQRSSRWHTNGDSSLGFSRRSASSAEILSSRAGAMQSSAPLIAGRFAGRGIGIGGTHECDRQ